MVGRRQSASMSSHYPMLWLLKSLQARDTRSRSHYAFLRILRIPRSRYPISYACYAFLQDFNKLCAPLLRLLVRLLARDTRILRIPRVSLAMRSKKALAGCAYCESRACPLLCAEEGVPARRILRIPRSLFFFFFYEFLVLVKK